MIISINQRKHLTKIQCPFTIKILSKLEIGGNLCNLIKEGHLWKANRYHLSGERMNVIRIKARMSALSTFVQHSFCSAGTKAIPRNKMHVDYRGRSKTVFICRKIIVENSKESTKELLEITNEFSRVLGSKLKYKNWLRIYGLSVNNWKLK